MAIDQFGIWDMPLAKTHTFSRSIAQWVKDHFDPVLPVYDLGCGNGAYSAFLSDKFSGIYAYEGTADIDKVAKYHPIHRANLCFPLAIEKPGQVLCLEVVEHIPKQYESQILDAIAACAAPGSLNLISWAVVGQGGDGHVNCRDAEYVFSVFAARKFSFDSKLTAEIRALSFPNCGWFKNSSYAFRKK